MNEQERLEMEKELAAAEESERQVKIKTCGGKSIQLQIGEIEQITEDGVRRRRATWDYFADGDCRWFGHSIDLYSNGEFSHIIGRIFDRGTFYGDRFQCTVTFYVADRPVVSWNWGEGPYCGPGQTRTNLSKNGNDSRIRLNFDRIDRGHIEHHCN